MGARKGVSTAAWLWWAGDLLPQAQPGCSKVSKGYPLYSACPWLEAVLSLTGRGVGRGVSLFQSLSPLSL